MNDEQAEAFMAAVVHRTIVNVIQTEGLGDTSRTTLVFDDGGELAFDTCSIKHVIEPAGALVPSEASEASEATEAREGERAWMDRHGDVWTAGSNGLLHTPETRPFDREYVERMWGPLRAVAYPAYYVVPERPRRESELSAGRSVTATLAAEVHATSDRRTSA